MNDFEIALLIKAQKGDIKAFEELLLRIEKTIYNAVYRLVLNQEDAKDLTQEVVIKIYKNLNKCDDARAFKGWMFRIIKNTCMDEFRKRKNKYTESIDDNFDDDIEKQILSEGKTPEEEFITKETTTLVREAIDKLPENHRILIVLRDLNDLSYEEIAKITDTNIGTVKSRLSRARANLKQIIEDAGNKTVNKTSNKYKEPKGGHENV